MKSVLSSPTIGLAILVGLATIGNAQEHVQSSNPIVDGMWGHRTQSHYTILPRPATHFNRDEPNVSTPPRDNIQSRPTQPYAYGWFGTKSSPQWSRQFGHQKVYTQWTLK